MKWEHRCSLDWLRERQGYLTASDIKSLLPVTKTGRPRTVTDLDMMKVMSGKMVDLTEEDCMSYGAAARGHLLEPYAIDTLNEMLARYGNHETFFWWDDRLVSMPERSIAFSPDAMDVPMTNNVEAPSAIAEVKSYSPERHLVTAYTPKDQIEERWQIAAAMALLESIDHAYLVLYNPSMSEHKTFVIRFDRDDLRNEIGMVRKVEAKWDDFVQSGALTRSLPNGGLQSSLGGSEEEVSREIEQRQRLNP